MKRGTATLLIVSAMLLIALPALAQAPRQDVIWALTTTDPITLDGVLDEAAWAQAETKIIQWEVDAGIPGSGWKFEACGLTDPDPTYATLKFLIKDNQLFMGAVVQDINVGGSEEFNRFDGLLMAIKDHASTGAPKPPAEYFYSWWYAEEGADPQPPGQSPNFKGRWGSEPYGTPRTPEQIEAWDAVTVVDGLSNDDAEPDVGYTVEMRFNLEVMGYDVTAPEGDVIEWNISIYDCDGWWPFTAPNFCSNRVWWQSPWGNDMWHHEVLIFARPDVTTASGPLPDVGPELVINEILAIPTMDGVLDEEVWDDPNVYSFDIRYGDDALRETYPGIGPFRAGQYQPEVNEGLAFVSNPADATVWVFTNGNMLYMGFEARDRRVQFQLLEDQWDGFRVSITDRMARNTTDHNLEGRPLTFVVGEDGNASPQEYLSALVDVGDAQVAMALLGDTDVDPLGGPDEGFTAELAVDLTSLGYPPGLGDRVLFLGVVYYDGDSFSDPADNYGTRTWWYRERASTCCAAWAHMAPSIIGVGDDPRFQNSNFVTSYPNPSVRPLIKYYLPERNVVTLDVYNLRGELVEHRIVGDQDAGESEILMFGNKKMSAGVYLYRLKLADPVTGRIRTTLSGKTVLLK